MSALFFLNILYFSLEVFGALVFFIIAWLAFDAYLLRKDALSFSRSMGFLLLAFWQLLHAFNPSSDILMYAGYLIYYAGLSLIIIGLWKESFLPRPKFEAMFIVPSIASLYFMLNGIAFAGLLTIALLSFRQYKKESKKSLLPYSLGFLFLAIRAGTSLFYHSDSIWFLWSIGHLFELAGFLFLGWWVWSYLQSRVREKMLIILTAITLFMAIVVSSSFSAIVVGQIQEATGENLIANTKVLNNALSRLKEEAGAKVALIAQEEALKTSLRENNVTSLDTLLSGDIKKSDLEFLMVLDNRGIVILRAHAFIKRGDDLSAERAVKSALDGESLVSIESSAGEGFSIRAASPIFSGGKMIGVLVGGFRLDDAFVDSIKNLTGLDTSVYNGMTRVATTIFNPDQQQRSAGITETNENIIDAVMIRKVPITTSFQVSSKYYLTAYVPIIDDGQTVGMISSAKAQSRIITTIDKTNQLTLITVVILMFILALPVYFITRRLGQELG